MKAGFLWASLWLTLFSGLAHAETVEAEKLKCQKFAHDFAENPDSLNEDQLKQLQFCVAKTLEQRYETNPPDLLKGTIIEPPSSSIQAPGTTIPTPSQHPGGKN